MLNIYGTVINRFSREFDQQFCNDAGTIKWDALVAVSSATTPFISRPPAKWAVSRLNSVATICDVLRYWEEFDTANQLVIAENSVTAAVTLPSARGFLIFMGNVESDGNINITMTDKGLISAAWDFGDKRCTSLIFLDIDCISVAATASDGSHIKIGNNERVTRKTAIKQLINQGLFTPVEEP